MHKMNNSCVFIRVLSCNQYQLCLHPDTACTCIHTLYVWLYFHWFSLFLKHSYDPLRYTELDLQPFWTSVSERFNHITPLCYYFVINVSQRHCKAMINYSYTLYSQTRGCCSPWNNQTTMIPSVYSLQKFYRFCEVKFSSLNFPLSVAIHFTERIQVTLDHTIAKILFIYL